MAIVVLGREPIGKLRQEEARGGRRRQEEAGGGRPHVRGGIRIFFWHMAHTRMMATQFACKQKALYCPFVVSLLLSLQRKRINFYVLYRGGEKGVRTMYS